MSWTSPSREGPAERVKYGFTLGTRTNSCRSATVSSWRRSAAAETKSRSREAVESSGLEPSLTVLPSCPLAVFRGMSVSTGEDPARVVNEQRLDVLLREAVATQPWHEVVEYVGVTSPAIAHKLNLDEDVLRDEDASEQTSISQALQCPRVLLVRRRLRLLIGVEVVHTDHVVFQ